MWAFEFLIGHVIFNLRYNQIYQLKTTMVYFSTFFEIFSLICSRAAGLETEDKIAVVAKCSALNMSTKLRAGSSEAPINFFTLLLKIYFMGYIHQ